MHSVTLHHRAHHLEHEAADHRAEDRAAGILLMALPIIGVVVSLGLTLLLQAAALPQATLAFALVFTRVLLMISIIATFACVPAAMWLLWMGREDAAHGTEEERLRAMYEEDAR
jgi:hypothetical protein